MIIRVDSIDNLTQDVADCIHTPVEKMLHDIRSIDFRMGDKSGLYYLALHEHEKLTSVFLCHLARRLDNSHGSLLLPLDKLLLTPNVFSDFLREFDICFQKDSLGEIVLFHGKQKINWKNNKNKGFNPSRFSKRLNQDFCVNGFQFLYDINTNVGPDYHSYMSVPEIIQDLEYLLGIGLVQKYRNKSNGYVALCKLPCAEVVFDSPWDGCDFDTQYLYSALSFIWEYHYAKTICVGNPILRALDTSDIYVERWIEEDNIPQRT